jgi:probable phosphoglycerate mutase
MPTLLLIRHGENEYTRAQKLAGRLPAVHLNAKGREQAAALAEGMKSIKLKALYSSPLERALETAEPIAAAQGLPVQVREELMETDVGDWQGKSIQQLRKTKAWKRLQEQPARFRFPGGESMVEQQARLVEAVEALCKPHKARDLIAVVGHADPIKLVLAHYIGLPLDLFQRLMVGTASVSTLVVEDGAARLVNLNQSFSK